MPLTPASLSAQIVANLGTLDSDSSNTNAQYSEGSKKLADAIANAVVQVLTTEAQVMIPSGAVVTAGSPTTQSNPAPVIGQIV